MSHARNHYLKAVAAGTAPADTLDQSQASAYELMLMQLAEHKRRLKGIASFEHRDELKRQYLPDYQPWIDGVLASDSGRADAVLMTVMVWKIDIGDVAGALPIARYALKHELVMPDQYQRSVACVLGDEAADQSLRHLAMTGHEPLDTELLTAVVTLLDGHDMPDQVRAKLFKALGYALREAGYLDASLGYLERALKLHDKVGVKKDIERLARAIKKRNDGGDTGNNLDDDAATNEGEDDSV